MTKQELVTTLEGYRDACIEQQREAGDVRYWVGKACAYSAALDLLDQLEEPDLTEPGVDDSEREEPWMNSTPKEEPDLTYRLTYTQAATARVAIRDPIASCGKYPVTPQNARASQKAREVLEALETGGDFEPSDELEKLRRRVALLEDRLNVVRSLVDDRLIGQTRGRSA